MADVIPVKKVPGGLAEFGAADKVPAENLPATEWAAETVSQAEAEAGTATTRRAWTAQRVRQAIAAWWAASAMKTKLDGIAANATANSTDAELRDRSTHTGTQAASSISDLAEVTQDTVSAMMVAGTNVSLSYNDTTGTITVNATGGVSGGAVDSVNGQTGTVVLDAADVGAEYPLSAGANIAIDRTDPQNPVISASGGGGPSPYPASASEALTAGDFVNVYSSGGNIMVRKADGGSAKLPAHGFVLASVGSGTTAQVSPLTSTNDALSGLIPGTEYYLSTSVAGGVQTTPPNATNVLRQSLGVAISATAIVTTNAMAVELV